MKKTRIKIELPTLMTRQDAEAAMNDLATAVNTKNRLTTQMDAQLITIKSDYEAPLAAVDEIIQTTTDTLRAWAEANPETFPKGSKSLTLVAGTLGFRTGTPKLALLSRAFNWDLVLAMVKQFWPSFIRTEEAVDKQGLLGLHSQAEDKLASDAELRRLGLKVVQEESFYIEPDLTTLATRKTETA